ncbi:ATP-binding protein [Ochrobactrum sp. MYb379]|uniref:ATP-binding protein n=1 Tax=Ochrobactrum sp. MYb379 TaxID=2745275 RepID=UPI00309E6398
MPQSRLNIEKIMKLYWVLAMAIIAVCSAAATYSIYKDYLNRSHDAGQKAMMFAQALAEQTTQVVDSLDYLSRAVKRDVVDKMVPDEFLSEVLKRRTQAETDAVIGIAVVDRSGHVYASDISAIPIDMDLSKSEEYKELSQPGSPVIFINHPSVREIDLSEICIGQTMSYSRALIDEQGKFNGLVLILVNEHYLYNSYERFKTETDIVLGLVGEDGVIRASNNSLAIGLNIRSHIEKELAVGEGIQIRYSPIVHQELILAYYKSSSIPLWAYAGFPTSPIRSAWFKGSIVAVLMIVTLFAILIACGVLLKNYVINQKKLIFRDTEDIKSSKELEIFHNIARASDLLMVVTDSLGKIIVTNANFQSVFTDIDPNGQLSFKSVLGIDVNILNIKPSWQGTHRINTSGNKKREINWVVSIIRAEENYEVRNFVILGLDITDRREAELAIYQSAKLVTLGQMATGIAHELSQPLATLAMVLDNLEHSIRKKTYDVESCLEQITEMSAQVERASKIARHMRIYGHKTNGSMESLQPVKIVESVMVVCEEQIRSENINIEHIFPDFLPEVKGNHILVEQILLNFIVNSRDAILIKGGGIAIHDARITIKVESKNDGFVNFSVEDNGSGIETDVEGKLFEPFYTTKPEGHGMGLGLALCLGMAKDMNGKIEIIKPDEGTIFVLSLPIYVTNAIGG